MPHRSLARRFFASSIPCLVVFASSATAQAPETALEQLARAKAAYDAENSAVGASLVELFDARTQELLADEKSSAEKLAKATAKNDAEREAFEQRGAWPPSFQREELTRRRRSAREALVKACQDAEQALTLAQRADESAGVAADRAAFELAKDLAPWRSAASFRMEVSDLESDLRRWIPGGDGWSSPTTDPAKQQPVPFVLRADVPEGALRYALRFEVQRLGEACGLDVQFLDSAHHLVQHHVSAAELDLALASKVYGRPQSAQFVLVVQDGYLRLDAEGRAILRRTNGESAPDAIPATENDPWFGLVPRNGAKIRISAVDWKPIGAPEKGADSGTFRPKSRELVAQVPARPAGSTVSASAPIRAGARPRMLRPRARAPAVELAILDGLRWLARHQDDDGSWTPSHAARHCASDSASYSAQPPDADQYDTAVTAMGLLAFLGTGIDATTKLELVDEADGGRYEVGEIVRQAVAFLSARQSDDGSFSRPGTTICVDALATRALCEAFHVLQDPDLGAQAQNALDFLQSAQVRDSVGVARGWRSEARANGAKDAPDSRDVARRRDPYDADTAATGWCIGALRAGQLAGLQVDPGSILGGVIFVRQVAETAEGSPTGLLAYHDANSGGARSARSFDEARCHPAAMSAIGLFVRRIAGPDAIDPFLVMTANALLSDMPAISADRASIDYFYWHQGTLALSFLGGPDAPKRNTTYWVPWRTLTADALLAVQDRTEGSCTHGGWLTPDRWAHEHGGPMCATALNVLTLQLLE